MYRTWQHLIIQNETGLQDPVRLRKLSRSSSRVGWVAVVGFIFAGVISLLLAIFLFNEAFENEERILSFLLSGLLVLVVGFAFFIGAWLFRKEMALNPLRGFLKNPGEYIVVQGQLEDCHYLAGEKRHYDRIVVEGHAVGPLGERLIVREEFAPAIWNFTTPQGERSLQKGVDWYSKKGQRRLLPVPAYFLCRKLRPGQASLIAIREEYIN
jgi:hypothetical protein